MQLTNFFQRFFTGKSYFEDFPVFLRSLYFLSLNGFRPLFHAII